MQREDMLAKVEAAYQARRTGDFDKLKELVADNAEWTVAGEESLIAGFPGAGGVDVHQAARHLFDTIELRTLERVDALAEGNRVAILWKTNVVIPGSEPFETLMYDLWEFDDSGKICKGMQFVDTAKFIEAMRGRQPQPA
ncbi:MAG TPA: nuclear transport factor 2 family protein [Sphingomicrobium sp.]|jgi:ketosteroid isomerase-like protein